MRTYLFAGTVVVQLECCESDCFCTVVRGIELGITVCIELEETSVERISVGSSSIK